MTTAPHTFRKKDVVKIKVKLCNGAEEPLYKQFSFDPCVTSFNVLLRILARAFSITSDFSVSYLATDSYGEQFYLPLLSEWDLDAAILTASDPVLRMQVELRNKDTGLEDWDIVVPGEIPSQQKAMNQLPSSVHPKQRSILTNYPNTGVHNSNNASSPSLLSHLTHNILGRGVSSTMQRALEGMKLVDTSDTMPAQWKTVKGPMTDAEYKNFMDCEGRLVSPREFKHAVYLGGVDASLRKVAWRALLDVYPPGFTGKKRLECLRKQSQQYFTMKNVWKKAYSTGRLTPQQITLIAGISVDVVRTDRSHNFYASEDVSNSKVSQLFDVLVTYSLHHPSVGYSQGMSDLASPLLFVQGGDEGAAYVCLCALMRRVKWNFHANGRALVTKLQHLHDLLVFYDAPFANTMKERGLGDMFFAHRWLLLELKREFKFDDALKLLELQWAAVPPGTVPCEWDNGVEEQQNLTAALMEVEMSEDAFHYVATGSKEVSISSSSDTSVRSAQSSYWASHYAGHDLRLINSLVGQEYAMKEQESAICRSPGPEDLLPLSSSTADSVLSHSNSNSRFPPCDLLSHSPPDKDTVADAADADTPFLPMSSGAVPSTNGPSTATRSHHGLVVLKESVAELPPPNELGSGSPFLLFLSLSLLLEYREPILQHVQEMFDFSLFFRRLQQNHNVTRIVGRARHMFNEYLNVQEAKSRHLEGFPELQISL